MCRYTKISLLALAIVTTGAAYAAKGGTENEALALTKGSSQKTENKAR